MDILFLLVIFLLGSFCGTFIYWILFRTKLYNLSKLLLYKSKIIETLQINLNKELVLRVSAEEKSKLFDYFKNQIQTKSKKLNLQYEINSELRAKLSVSIEASKQKQSYIDNRIKDIREEHKLLMSSFSSLSTQALLKNNESFLSIANLTLEKWQIKANAHLLNNEIAINNCIKPLKINLEKMNKNVLELELSRHGAYSEIKQQITSLLDAKNLLQKEINTLNQALASPVSRGRWGEMQLKRVIEISGMTSLCDFIVQPRIIHDEKEYRPDLIVKLPGKRTLIIDAKVPLDDYLKGINSKNESLRKASMLLHAEKVRRHIKALSKKTYWKKFQHSPEFVILFLPGESFFYSALEQDPSIIEMGIDNGVIVATPMILIALLKAIAYSWKHENYSKNASDIINMAQVLTQRIDIIIKHLSKLGLNISGVVDSYNQTLASFKSRVLSIAKKLEELGHKQEKNKKIKLSTITKITNVS